MIASYQHCELELLMNGNDLPKGVSIMNFILREFTLYTVPMLDISLLDISNSLKSTTDPGSTLVDGTLLNVTMTFNKDQDSEFVRKMDFRVCKVSPLIMVSNSAAPTTIHYHLSCVLNTNLLMSNVAFSYTGNVQGCLEKIFYNDISDITLITDFDDSIVHNFKKLKTESFARYIKQLTMAISNPDNSAYYAYFHDGENVSVLDILAILKGYGDTEDYSTFVISEKNFIKMQPVLDSYTRAKKSGSYGCTAHQFDYNTGTMLSQSSATSQVVKSCTIDIKTVDNPSIVMPGSMGNHTNEYIKNYVNNLRNYGLFSFKAWFRFIYPTQTNGLQCVEVKYKDGEPIPFIVMGREIRLKNGAYVEDLLVYSNTMNQDLATMFAGG